MSQHLLDDGRLIDTLAYCLQVEGPPVRRLEAALEFIRTQYAPEAEGLLLSFNSIRPADQRIVPGRLVAACRRPEDLARYIILREPHFRHKIDESFARIRAQLSASGASLRSGNLSEMIARADFDPEEWRKQFFKPVGLEEVWNATQPIGNSGLGSIVAPQSVGASPLSPEQLDLLCSVVRVLVPTLLQISSPGGLSEASGLSAAQQLVLEQAVAGLPEKQIALKLHRSHHTVHSHLRAIYRRYGVSSRAELLALVLDDTRPPSSD